MRWMGMTEMEQPEWKIKKSKRAEALLLFLFYGRKVFWLTENSFYGMVLQ